MAFIIMMIAAMILPGFVMFFLARKSTSRLLIAIVPATILVLGIALLLWSSIESNLNFGAALVAICGFLPAAISALVGGLLGRPP